MTRWSDLHEYQVGGKETTLFVEIFAQIRAETLKCAKFYTGITHGSRDFSQSNPRYIPGPSRPKIWAIPGQGCKSDEMISQEKARQVQKKGSRARAP